MGCAPSRSKQRCEECIDGDAVAPSSVTVTTLVGKLKRPTIADVRFRGLPSLPPPDALYFAACDPSSTTWTAAAFPT